MKPKRDTNVLITAEYPQFADPGILAQVVPEFALAGQAIGFLRQVASGQ